MSTTDTTDTTPFIKVSVLGAAGGIGQPLSLLLKLNPHINELALYDVVNIPGVAADLNHIDTDVKITCHMKSKSDDSNSNESLNESLKNAIENSNFIIIPAGLPRKPGMTRGDLFNINAIICKELAEYIALYSPNSIVLIISNPVNSTVAVFKEIFVKFNIFNPKKLFGVTILDHVRSNTFISELIDGTLPNHYNVPVVGGHSGHSIVPLFSQSNCDISNLKILNDENILDSLIHRVQYGGDEIVKAKNGLGSATLSMAYAGNKFFNIILNGYLNIKEIKISSYIYLDDSIPGIIELKNNLKILLNKNNKNIKIPEFLATPMTFDLNGIKNVDYTWVNKMNHKEQEMFFIAADFINQNVEKGINFVHS